MDPSPLVAEWPLVLASASERRRRLLESLGLPFTVVPADVDESARPGESAEACALRLAREKARAVAARHGEGTVLAADTLAALGDRSIGKPRDEEDARAILRSLSGTEHRVVTGVAVLRARAGREASGVAVTAVTMRPLTEDDVRGYVASGEAMGKAGAYAVQETGDRFVASMRGDFDNVVGLPMRLVRELLAEAAR
jgi:septum formation protein